MTPNEKECLELVQQSLELSKSMFEKELNNLSELKDDAHNKEELNKLEMDFTTILKSIENLKKQIELAHEQK